MAKTETTKTAEAIEARFIGKVSSYSASGRKHVEVPNTKRHLFKPGDAVRVEKID